MRLCFRFPLSLAVLFAAAALCRADGSGVVRVRNGTSQGSAAVVGRSGSATYLLTAHHCCAFSDTVKVECYPGTYTGRVVKRSKADDLALVVLDDAPAPAKVLPLAARTPAAGAASLVSCPAGVEPCVRSCVIGAEGYYARVDSRPGSSGGAVVQGGRLVGIHTTAGTFTPLSKVRAFLAGERGVLLGKGNASPAAVPSVPSYPSPAVSPPAAAGVRYSGTFTKPGTYTFKKGSVTIEIEIK